MIVYGNGYEVLRQDNGRWWAHIAGYGDTPDTFPTREMAEREAKAQAKTVSNGAGYHQNIS